MKDQNHNAKAVLFNRTGGADVLELHDIKMPEPADNEVLLHVKSVGLNRADIMYRMGIFAESPVFPAKLGYEAAGVVEKAGEQWKTTFKKGDMVNVLPAFSLHDYATYGDFIVVPGYSVQRYPEKLSFDEAAALWTSYLATYGMLVDAGNIKQSDFVIINAASSSTGLAAIQMVNYCGGISIALTTSPRKKERLLAAGAKYVVDTSDTEFGKKILAITNGHGADIILDPVTGKNFNQLVQTIAVNGKVFIYGVLSLEQAIFPSLPVLIKTPTIRGYSTGEVLANPEKLSRAVEYINKGISAGMLKPIIDRTFTLEEIALAHGYMETNAQFGKVVVNP